MIDHVTQNLKIRNGEEPKNSGTVPGLFWDSWQLAMDELLTACMAPRDDP